MMSFSSYDHFPFTKTYNLEIYGLNYVYYPAYLDIWLVVTLFSRMTIDINDTVN